MTLIDRILGDHDPVSNATEYRRYPAETNLAEAIADTCPRDALAADQQRHFEEEMLAVKGDEVAQVVWIAYITILLCRGDREPAIIHSSHAS